MNFRRLQKNNTNQTGASLVELMLAVAIFITAVAAVAHLFVGATTGMNNTVKKMKASLLNNESLEAVKSIKNESFHNLSRGNYETALVDNKYELISTDGLVGHWMLNGNGLDSSKNNNHGEIFGATPTEDRKDLIEGAMSFDGSDDYIKVPHNSTVDISNKLTVSFWAHPDNKDIFEIVTSKQSSGATDRGFRIHKHNDGYWGVLLSDGSSYIDTHSAIVEVGEWQHITATYNRKEGQAKFYKNGYLVDTVSFSSQVDTIYDLHIGTRRSLSAHYTGKLDDVRIYNRALSESEIKNLYNKYEGKYKREVSISDVDDGLIGHWKLNNNPADSSGNNNHGTLNGSADFISGDKFTTSREGVKNNSLDFDGNYGTYVEIVNDEELKIEDAITLSAWFYPRGYKDNGGTYDHWERMIAKDTRDYSMLLLSNEYLKADFTINGTRYNPQFKGVELNEWNHGVIIYDDPDLIFYLNGKHIGTSTTGGGSIRTSSNNLFIGNWQGGDRPFNGVLDDVRVYNRALEKNEIKKLYKSTKLDVETTVKKDNKEILSFQDILGNYDYNIFSQDLILNNFINQKNTYRNSKKIELHTPKQVSFTQTGSHTWKVPEEVREVEVLVVAGGGGGGSNGGGGGGAGGVVYVDDYDVTPGEEISVNVGAGGEGRVYTDGGLNGEDSTFDTLTAIGGGGGGTAASDITDASNDGGSGGGGGQTTDDTGGAALQPGTNINAENNGNNGGQGINNGGGGGGGAAEDGKQGYTTTAGGDGGDGVYFGDIFGDEYGEDGYFGGGGGGGSNDQSDSSGAKYGVGGKGGGGDGANIGETDDEHGEDGTPNTGGGGGGADQSGKGGNGGSGIVIVKWGGEKGYQTSKPINLQTENVRDNKIKWKSSLLKRTGIEILTAVTNENKLYSLDFDGTDDKVNVGLSGVYSDFTFSLWASADNWDTSSRRQFGAVPDGVDDSAMVDFGIENGKLKHWRGNAASTVASSYKVSGKNGWRHVLYTQERLDSSTVEVKLYFDGQLVQTVSGDWEDIDFSVGDLIIGDHIGDFSPWEGKLDDVRFYNRPLSAIEVKDLYHQKAVSDGLVGYWPISQGEGSIVEDLSGNNNSGTIDGAVWSTDNSGAVPGGFYKTINNGKIPQIGIGDDLSNKYLWIRGLLKSEDSKKTPTFESLEFRIDGY